MKIETLLTDRKLLNPIIFLLAYLCIITSVYAQNADSSQSQVYIIDDIVVTASRIPMTFSEISRSVTIISSGDITSAPVHSVQDLLEYSLGVDVRQRGRNGVQADISIRGATFEQTLILIDGIKVGNPQTGHHNMDLPLTLADIKRIEILRGQGSRLYGPNAFGGVINIITKSSRQKQVNIKASVGDFRNSEGAISISYPLGNTVHRLSLSKKKSAGYCQATDFDISTLYYKTSIETHQTKANLSFGYIDKEFGANRFYSDNFDNEWEHTKSSLLQAGLNQKIKQVSLNIKASWKNHNDDFILDKARPDWYRNKHTTDIYSIEVQADFSSRLGHSVIGGEGGKELIASTSLGDHSRTRGGCFIEHKVNPVKKLSILIGASAYHYTEWGWQFWPGLSSGYAITEKLQAFGSIGKSFRVPTFTELYYDSPANKGSLYLCPEEGISYETGIKWNRQNIRGDLAIFRREGRNLIDWVRINSDNPWQARNIAMINANGLEVGLDIFPIGIIKHTPISRIQIGYTYLDLDKQTGNYQSKYALDQFKHQFIMGVYHKLFYGLSQTWKIRYEKPLINDNRLLVDTRIKWKFKKLEWYMEAANLFDTDYKEIGAIPMPGRIVMTGLTYNLF